MAPDNPTCLVAKKHKTENGINVVPNSIKTLKMVHVKKKKKSKKKKGVLLSRTVRGCGVQRQRRPEHVFVLL